MKRIIFIFLLFLSAHANAEWVNYGGCAAEGDYQYDQALSYISSRGVPDLRICGYKSNGEPYFTFWYWPNAAGDPDCGEGSIYDSSSKMCTDAPPPIECPPSGTAPPSAINLTIAPGGSWPYRVVIDGCVYTLPTTGHPDVDGQGNNCIVNPDESLNCFFSGSATGEDENTCDGDCVTGPTPQPDTPQVVKPPEAVEQSSQTDPGTGAQTNTVKTTGTEILPDGSVKTTTTTVKDITVDGQTTTITDTEVVTTNKDGRTTTTNVQTTKNPDGNTSTTASGTQTGGPAAKNSGDEQEGKGKCDPTKPNYAACTGYTEEISDTKAAELKTALDTKIDETVEASGNEQIADIQSEMQPMGNSDSLVNQVKNFFPNVSGCADITYSWNGHTMALSCAKLQPLRDILAWLFAGFAMMSCFYITFRSPAGA